MILLLKAKSWFDKDCFRNDMNFNNDNLINFDCLLYLVTVSHFCDFFYKALFCNVTTFSYFLAQATFCSLYVHNKRRTVP